MKKSYVYGLINKVILTAYIVNTIPIYAFEDVHHTDMDDLSIIDEANTTPLLEESTVEAGIVVNEGVSDDAVFDDEEIESGNNDVEDVLQEDVANKDSIPNDPIIEDIVEEDILKDDTPSLEDNPVDNGPKDDLLGGNIPSDKSTVVETPGNTQNPIIDSEDIEIEPISSELTAYIEGTNKLYLNDSTSSKIVSDSWIYNETKTLTIQSDVSSLDSSTRYVDIILPIGMMLAMNPNDLVDGKTIVSVDTEEFGKESIVSTNSNYTHTSHSGKLRLNLSKDISSLSIDILVAVDDKLWNTINNVSATSKNNKAIAVSVGDKDKSFSKKLDDIKVVGNTWSVYYDSAIKSSILTKTVNIVTVGSSLDFIQKVHKRFYRKIVINMELPYYTYTEDGVTKRKYAELTSLTLPDKGTYTVDNGKVTMVLENVYLERISHSYKIIFPDEIDSTKRVQYMTGEIYVQDFFSDEMYKVRDWSERASALHPSTTEVVKNTPTSKDVYFDNKYAKPDVLRHLGGYNISNDGVRTTPKRLSFLFPNGRDSGVGVTVAQLMAPPTAATLDIEYTLWDKETLQEYSNKVSVQKSSSKIHRFFVDDAVKLSNNPSLRGKQLYFKNISYDVGELPEVFDWGSGSEPSGTSIWGHVFDTAPNNKTYSSAYTLSSLNDANEITNSVDKAFNTNIKYSGRSVGGINYFGFFDDKGKPLSTLTAGDSFVIKGNATSSYYPYYNTLLISAPMLRLRLEKGFDIDTSSTYFEGMVDGVKKRLSYEIANKNDPRLLSDGSRVYDIIITEDDFVVGYYDNKMKSISEISCNVVVSTSKSAKTASIKANRTLFFDDQYISITGGGSWDSYFVKDTLDINGNGSKTDTLATTNKDISFNIISNGSWLDTSLTMAVNDEEFSNNSLVLTKATDILNVKLAVNNINDGIVRKGDFEYYIPIPKTNKTYNSTIKDSTETFDFDLNLAQLASPVDGFTITYSIDGKNYVTGDKIKDLSKVYMIKIVSSKDIAPNTQKDILIKLNYDKDSSPVDTNDNIWSAYGYQTYVKNGATSSFNHVFDKTTIFLEEEKEDNWLNREVARQAGKSLEDLLTLDYKSILNISLPNKNLTGPIPKDIRKLTNLVTLNVSGNKLTGSIPDHLYSLAKVREVNLSNNLLEGELSSNIVNMKAIQKIDFSSNEITGRIPKSIGSLKALRYLNLSNNKLIESIPPEIGDIQTLTDEINLSNNQLVGKVPSNFPERFNNSKYLGYNILDGQESQKQLVFVNPYEINTRIGSKLNPSINSEEVKLIWESKEEELNSIYSTSVVFDDPTFVDKILTVKKSGETNIRMKISLSADDNTFAKASNPIKLFVADELKLSLSLNTSTWTNGDVSIIIKGSSNIGVDSILLPDGETTTESSTVYKVAENGTYEFKITNTRGETFTSSIEVSNIDRIKPVMKVSYDDTPSKRVVVSVSVTDDMSGVKHITLPNGTVDAEEKSSFIVRNNGTYIVSSSDKAGNIVSQSVTIDNIDDSLLDDAWLDKEVSRQTKTPIDSLKESDYLKITKIDLKNKKIEGKIPSHISGLKNLETLNLSRNELTGTIPVELANLPKLASLNLSENALAGTIPKEFFAMKNLHTLDLGYNELSGALPVKIDANTKLRFIYLCENQLTGTIPEALANLKSARDLCLDYNQFAGKIGPKVKAMKAFKNFDYNFIKEDSISNSIVFDDNIIVDVKKDEPIDTELLRGFLRVTTDLSTSLSVSDAYEIVYLYEDNDIIVNGVPVKSGAVRARVALAYNGSILEELTSDKYIKVRVSQASLGDVTINYIDTESREKISDSIIHSGLEFDEYSFGAKKIDNYTLVGESIKTIAINADRPSLSIDFEYKKNSVPILGSIEVSYIDEETGMNLGETQLYSNLELTEHLINAKDIHGYTIVGNTSVKVILDELNPNTSIVFRYTKVTPIVRGSVTINHINALSGEDVADSQVFNDLELGDYTYSALDIDGFVVEGDSTMTVSLTNEVSNLTISFKYTADAPDVEIPETEQPDEIEPEVPKPETPKDPIPEEVEPENPKPDIPEEVKPDESNPSEDETKDTSGLDDFESIPSTGGYRELFTILALTISAVGILLIRKKD